jgi:hypothetical protein
MVASPRERRTNTTGLTRTGGLALLLLALWQFVDTGGVETLMETLRLVFSRDETVGATGPTDVAAAPAKPPFLDGADGGAGPATDLPDSAAGTVPAPSAAPLSRSCTSADAKCIRAKAEWDCSSASLLLQGDEAPPEVALEIRSGETLLGVISSDPDGRFRVQLPLEHRARSLRLELDVRDARSGTDSIPIRPNASCSRS